jgi:hypothetical protein
MANHHSILFLACVFDRFRAYGEIQNGCIFVGCDDAT